jgi:hypothetical protein
MSGRRARVGVGSTERDMAQKDEGTERKGKVWMFRVILSLQLKTS